MIFDDIKKGDRFRINTPNKEFNSECYLVTTKMGNDGGVPYWDIYYHNCLHKEQNGTFQIYANDADMLHNLVLYPTNEELMSL